METLLNGIFIHAKTKSGFLRNKDKIKDGQIVFIEESKEIYIYGNYYPCPYTKEELDLIFKSFQDALLAEQSRAELAEQTNAQAIGILNGDSTIEGSVAKKVSTEIAKIIANAPENFDTLKEIADWIANDTIDTVGLINKITANENSINLLNGNFEEEGSVYYKIKQTEKLNKMLRFTALKNSTISLISKTDPDIEYSFDGNDWIKWDYSTITLNEGQTVYMKGDNPNGFSTSYYNYNQFNITGKIKVRGNIMSLLYGDDFEGRVNIPCNYCFYMLFYNCTSLTTAPELPATTLAKYCYEYMFSNCTSLTTAPELPATTLAERCCFNMFYNCTSLTTAPELPATTLTDYCYNGMFMNCTSLTTPPELPATTLAHECYGSMFYKCSSLTTAPELPATTLAKLCYFYMFYNCTSLTIAPELHANTLAKACYQGMFQNCSKLTTAPELPATTLAEDCYHSMFNGCTLLNYIKMLATNIFADGCLYEWVTGVTSTGMFVKAEGVDIPTGIHGIPEGWDILINNYKHPDYSLYPKRLILEFGNKPVFEQIIHFPKESIVNSEATINLNKYDNYNFTNNLILLDCTISCVKENKTSIISNDFFVELHNDFTFKIYSNSVQTNDSDIWVRIIYSETLPDNSMYYYQSPQWGNIRFRYMGSALAIEYGDSNTGTHGYHKFGDYYDVVVNVTNSYSYVIGVSRDYLDDDFTDIRVISNKYDEYVDLSCGSVSTEELNWFKIKSQMPRTANAIENGEEVLLELELVYYNDNEYYYDDQNGQVLIIAFEGIDLVENCNTELNFYGGDGVTLDMSGVSSNVSNVYVTGNTLEQFIENLIYIKITNSCYSELYVYMSDNTNEVMSIQSRITLEGLQNYLPTAYNKLINGENITLFIYLETP